MAKTIINNNMSKDDKKKVDEKFQVTVFDHLLIKEKETDKILLNKRG